MFSAGSASQLLSNATPIAAPPRVPGRGYERQESGGGGKESAGFGPSVVVDIRSGASGGTASSGKAGGSQGPSEEEEKAIQKLKARDQEVRMHEQAHAAVGGAHAGSPSYTYQTGPDGKRYAIGGQVQIDTSPESSPEATIRKMETVKRAAMSPAEPSGQDAKVAQSADKIRQDAERELNQRKAAEAETQRSGGTEPQDGTGFPQRADARQGADQAEGAEAAGTRAPANGADRDFTRFAAASAAYGGTARLAMGMVGAGQGAGGIGMF